MSGAWLRLPENEAKSQFLTQASLEQLQADLALPRLATAQLLHPCTFTLEVASLTCSHLR